MLKKQKEEAERQSLERKNRLVMLKEASVKRLRETTAVAEALKQKEAVLTLYSSFKYLTFSDNCKCRRLKRKKGKTPLKWPRKELNNLR